MAKKNLLKGFKRPKSIIFEHSESDANYGKFVAYPFERGYGTTIGNTLRRILLSSIQGYAVTAIKLTHYNDDGSPHLVTSEYESLDDIVEDIPDLINNIKQLQIKVQDEEESKTVTIPLKGPGTFTGKDMEKADGSVIVTNSDLVIGNLTDRCNLEVEMQIDLGRGYVSAERNEQYIDVVGTIAIDTFFSPIVKVKYLIEDTRVGQRTDYDKLILEIWTNGSISPEDALAEASKIAKDHFTIFINFDEDEISSHEEVDEEDEELMRFLATPVEELELSVRSSNCLKNANIRTIGDLTEKTEDDIVKTRNFGKKSLQEIKEKLKEWNLNLGMTDYSHLKPFKKIKAEKEVKNEA